VAIHIIKPILFFIAIKGLLNPKKKCPPPPPPLLFGVLICPSYLFHCYTSQNPKDINSHYEIDFCVSSAKRWKHKNRFFKSSPKVGFQKNDFYS
jgi:hypothetical protein